MFGKYDQVLFVALATNKTSNVKTTIIVNTHPNSFYDTTQLENGSKCIHVSSVQ